MMDIEMLRECAEAAGVKVWAVGDRLEIMNGLVSTGRPYDPLTDDAQAMALVKKFYIAIGRTQFEWKACALLSKTPEWSWNADLNRAIVETVAKAQRG